MSASMHLRKNLGRGARFPPDREVVVLHLVEAVSKKGPYLQKLSVSRPIIILIFSIHLSEGVYGYFVKHLSKSFCKTLCKLN